MQRNLTFITQNKRMMNSSLDSSINFLPEQKPDQSRLIPSYLEGEVQCELCAYEYDLAQRVPMMLCNSQHNCCLYCVKQIIVRKKQCPFCRTAISVENIHKNRMLCKILEEVARKKGIPIVINENPEREFIENRKSFLVPGHGDIAPDVNSILYMNDEHLNVYHELLNAQAEQSCCQKVWSRIELSEPLYCFAYFLVMFYSLPFFICELNYALREEGRKCLDEDFGVGMDLRTWLLSSGVIGLSMYGLQCLVILWKICLPQRKKFPQSLTIINIISFILKYLGYNILGFVVYGSIGDEGLSDCSGGVLDYMEALFIIEIVILCGLCSLVDRRRR